MALTTALMVGPSFFNQIGLGENDYGGNDGGSSVPDYQEASDAVRRQREEGQKAVDQLATAFKSHNEGLVKRIAKTEETAVAQLNKQKEAFKAKTIDVKDIDLPGVDPNVLLYGGLAFGAMALFIVMKK
jgi:hypothetical protein